MKNRFKEAYSSIKSNSGQEKHEVILVDSLSKPLVEDNIKAEGFHICALLQQSVNDGLNMDAYLKKNIDTTKLYSSILKIYDYSLRSDSFDTKRRFYNKHLKLRELHRGNLLSGGKFMLRKSQWAEAYQYFDMFLRTPANDADSVVGRVAYWATVCGMNGNNPQQVLKHVDTAIDLISSMETSSLAEYKARCVLHIGDTLQWLSLLDKGVDTYPGYNYFYLNMMEHYMRNNEYERGLARTDSLLKCDGDKAIYWFAMSMFALAQNDYEKCIEMSEECLQREPDNTDALYNKGISLLNLALDEKQLSKRRSLYFKALKPMERLRELCPDNIDRWGTPLYRIYLNLNMGQKFEEIDSILHKQANFKEENINKPY